MLKSPTEKQTNMTNQVDRHEEQRPGTAHHTHFDVNAAIDNVPRALHKAIWWQRIIGLYRDEGVLFQRTGVSQWIIDSCFLFVSMALEWHF